MLGLFVLVGCSAPAADEAETAPVVQETEDTKAGTPTVAPPKTVTWESSCMLTADEVNGAMEYLGWTGTAETHPINDDTTLTTCDYPEAGDTTRSVGVDFRLYNPASNYGWVTPDDSTMTFTAPDPATGAANACAVATSGTSAAGYEGVCTETGGVAVVVDAERYQAVLFPEGDAFYAVTLFGITGSEAAAETLLELATLLSTRELVAE